MIAAWMMYTMAVGFLLYAAAMGAEYVTRALRVPARFVWLFAMMTTVVLAGRALSSSERPVRPAPLLLNNRRSIRLETPGSIAEPSTSAGSVSRRPTSEGRTSVGPTTVEKSLARFSSIGRAVGGAVSRIDVRALDRWNRTLIIAWIALSALAVGWLLMSFLRLRRLAGELTAETIANRVVLVSEDVGPALLGILRTRIVLPRWVLELPPAEQEIIVAHERQHAVAFDPALVCASMCIVALQPWNVVLWTLLARLRLAVEADCDRRVLGEGGDVRAYGQLLVAMYERTSGLAPHVAFVERGSSLERRIRRITSRPRLFSVAVGASAIAATVFAAAAWKTSAPTRTTPLVSSAVGPSAIVASVLAAVPQKTPAPPRSAAPSETLTKSSAVESGHEEPQVTVPSESQRPRSAVAQVVGVQRHDVHQGPTPRSALAEAVPFTAVRAETSLIRVTIEATNLAEFRFVVPLDSTTRPIHVARGRAELIWGIYPFSSMMEITSLDTTTQVHVEAAQNGRTIASGEGTYLVLRRDSVGVTIEAWSHVPPSRAQLLPKSWTAMSNEQGGGAATGPCATPDSIAIRGLSRLSDAEVRSAIGITPKSTINGPVVTNALNNLDAINSFEPNSTATCELIGGKSVLVFSVTERRTEVSARDSISTRLVELELQRVSSGSDWTLTFTSKPRFDSEVAALHGRLRSLPDGIAADRQATGRVVLALEARASTVRSQLNVMRAAYTDEYPAVQNAQAEDRAISERLVEIRRSM